MTRIEFLFNGLMLSFFTTVLTLAVISAAICSEKAAKLVVTVILLARNEFFLDSASFPGDFKKFSYLGKTGNFLENADA